VCHGTVRYGLRLIRIHCIVTGEKRATPVYFRDDLNDDWEIDRLPDVAESLKRYIEPELVRAQRLEPALFDCPEIETSGIARF